MTAPRIWWDRLWDLVRGCTKVGAGCANCCSLDRFVNYYGPGRPYTGGDILDVEKGVWSGNVELREDCWDQPALLPRSMRVFVAGMGDLFHANVPDAYIDQVFRIMETVTQHQYLVLTKRVTRMRDYVQKRSTVPDHILLGASVENQECADERLPVLTDISHAHLWVNCEPLLSPVDLWPYLPKLVWLTAGPEEARPGARPMKPEWIRSLRDQCADVDIPFFSKDYLIDGVAYVDFFTPRQRQRAAS